MEKDIKPKPQKLVIILDGERLCFAAFVDPEQEKRIIKILEEHRQRFAQ